MSTLGHEALSEIYDTTTRCSPKKITFKPLSVSLPKLKIKENQIQNKTKQNKTKQKHRQPSDAGINNNISLTARRTFQYWPRYELTARATEDLYQSLVKRDTFF